MERIFDIFFSTFALLILSPLLIPIIIILRFSGEGEIFFLQNRIGKDGKIFKLYKFATMLKNSPNIGTGTVTLKNDPRVLPVGRFLRKTKINELPQLLNILSGDMSIIGPRPQTKRCFEAFPELSRNEIIKVRPGLSGIGSIIFRNEEEMMDANNNPDSFYNETLMPYKGSLEQWYVANHNLFSYFCLIFLTILAVINPKSEYIWKFFKDLPSPPSQIKCYLNYPLND